MKILSVLVVVFLVVNFLASDASPAAQLNEKDGLTTLTERKFVLREISRPTRKPSKSPRHRPTRKPTRNPSYAPSAHPTLQPTSTAEEQGPFSVGGGQNSYPVKLPASEQPTFLDVQPPHFGSWWNYFPAQTPPVRDHSK